MKDILYLFTGNRRVSSPGLSVPGLNAVGRIAIGLVLRKCQQALLVPQTINGADGI